MAQNPGAPILDLPNADLPISEHLGEHRMVLNLSLIHI